MTLGNEIGSVGQLMDAPSVVLWGILPAVIVITVICSITLWFRPSFTGTQMIETCQENKVTGNVNCKEREISKKWNLVAILILAVVLACGVGCFTYKMGIMIKNPKVGMGLVVTDLAVDAIFH